MSTLTSFQNVPAQNVPYFTPAQIPASGTAVPDPDGKPIPSLFKPIKIRGLELQNRIVLAPLGQYSGKDGFPTPWHMAHIGGIVSRGPGLSFIEATAVVPEGRITPEDLGIWSDEHIPALAELTTFAHSQNQKIAIQLAHAGRKGSTIAAWLPQNQIATEELGGWPDKVVAPSAIVHSDGFPTPKELTKEGIQGVVQAFADAARRSVQAGFDVVEIHGAHGFLLHSFMSPVSNHRTDEYGGSWENRTRILIEIVDAVRKVVPADMPVFYRISATDFLETSMPDTESWKVSDTIKLAPLLAAHGVDLLDVSSAGNHPLQSLGPIRTVEAYQSGLSAEIKAAVGDKIIVGAVGGIDNGRLAQRILDEGKADVIFVGRQFQRNPGTVWLFAEDLGVRITAAHQIEWAFFGRGVSRAKAN
ncbi:hypothetical protein PHLCEN_2v11940 [Hermanssonia centrifuga]|uniref:NADH:flavin oxidoreductase/NADH oxidase N-terminal domain-containing protein n=1 Tax=Hermanssonia centrifuga TaxID=98765 RepID=A0A2R6NIM3_9APHY|nr:hypothetical protein PHLCEN_2v11940 [Hermanssonia centrifuga]